MPDVGCGAARIRYDPPLAECSADHGGAGGAGCGLWRLAYRPACRLLSDPRGWSFRGVPAVLRGTRGPVAAADPRFAARAVESMWRDLGGKLTGGVRDGKGAPDLKPTFVVTSPAGPRWCAT